MAPRLLVLLLYFALSEGKASLGRDYGNHGIRPGHGDYSKHAEFLWAMLHPQENSHYVAAMRDSRSIYPGQGGSVAGRRCRTYRAELGVCKALHDCPRLVDLLLFSLLVDQSSEERKAPQILKNSVCNYYSQPPLVCCPSPAGMSQYSGPSRLSMGNRYSATSYQSHSNERYLPNDQHYSRKKTTTTSTSTTTPSTTTSTTSTTPSTTTSTTTTTTSTTTSTTTTTPSTTTYASTSTTSGHTPTTTSDTTSTSSTTYPPSTSTLSSHKK